MGKDTSLSNGCLVHFFPYLRVVIYISISFHLVTYIPKGKNKSWVHFCFEKLQNTCSRCGIVGYGIHTYVTKGTFQLKRTSSTTMNARFMFL